MALENQLKNPNPVSTMTATETMTATRTAVTLTMDADLNRTHHAAAKSYPLPPRLMSHSRI